MQKSEYDNLKLSREENEVDVLDLKNQEGKTFKEKVTIYFNKLETK